MAELLESGVVVGGQHFGVGVHVHARTFGLLEQHLQVAQIVAGNQDAGVGAHANVDLGDLGISVGAGVGGIQQSHNAYALVAGFKGQGHEIGHRKAVVQGLGQSFLQEVVHGGIMLAQHIGMLGIGGHALEAKGHEPAQGTNIVIACGKNAHSSSLGEHGGFVVRFPQGSVGQPVARAKLGHQGFLGGTGLAHALGDHVIVKVGIGDGAKKVAHDHSVDFVVHGLAQGAHFGGNLRKALGHIYQHVLKGCCFGLFAAHADLGAAFVAHGFLALIAEHGVTHGVSPDTPQSGGWGVIRLRGGLGGRKNDGKQHLEALLRAYRVRLAGGHDNHFTRLHGM